LSDFGEFELIGICNIKGSWTVGRLGYYRISIRLNMLFTNPGQTLDRYDFLMPPEMNPVESSPLLGK